MAGDPHRLRTLDLGQDNEQDPEMTAEYARLRAGLPVCCTQTGTHRQALDALQWEADEKDGEK